MHAVQELIHAVLGQVASQLQNIELAFDGHIAKYDGDTGKATIIIPVRGVDDSDGGDTPAAYQTGDIPVAVPFCGNKWGMQYIFKGGATVEKPNDGEPVLVIVQNRDNGYMYCVPCNYNAANWVPPMATPDDDSTSDPDDSPTADVSDDSDAGSDEAGTAKGQPGELIIKLEKNTLMKFYEDGSFRFNGVDSVALRVKKNANINIEEGDVNLMVKTGNVTSTLMKGNQTTDVRMGNVTFTIGQGNMSVSAPMGSINLSSKDINLTATQHYTLINGIAPP